MKTVRLNILSFLSVILIFGNGCMTNYCITQKAQSHLAYDPETDKTIQAPGQPGYYCFLPFTLAGDIVTSPLQLWLHLNSDSMIVSGTPPVPIPSQHAIGLPRP